MFSPEYPSVLLLPCSLLLSRVLNYQRVDRYGRIPFPSFININKFEMEGNCFVKTFRKSSKIINHNEYIHRMSLPLRRWGIRYPERESYENWSSVSLKFGKGALPPLIQLDKSSNMILCNIPETFTMRFYYRNLRRERLEDDGSTETGEVRGGPGGILDLRKKGSTQYLWSRGKGDLGR